jgi:hypothetical protein
MLVGHICCDLAEARVLAEGPRGRAGTGRKREKRASR